MSYHLTSRFVRVAGLDFLVKAYVNTEDLYTQEYLKKMVIYTVTSRKTNSTCWEITILW